MLSGNNGGSFARIPNSGGLHPDTHMSSGNDGGAFVPAGMGVADLHFISSTSSGLGVWLINCLLLKAPPSAAHLDVMAGAFTGGSFTIGFGFAATVLGVGTLWMMLTGLF